MAQVFTDTPKIGVNIDSPVAKEDLPRSGHRAGSKIFASDGKTYVFTVDGTTGVGSWVVEA